MTKKYEVDSATTGVEAVVFKKPDNSRWLVFGVGLDAGDRTIQAERTGFDSVEALEAAFAEVIVTAEKETGLTATDERVHIPVGGEFRADEVVPVPDLTAIHIILGTTENYLQKLD